MVHHSKAFFLPSSNVYQSRESSKEDTTGVIKVSSNIAGTPAMNHLNYVGVATSVWSHTGEEYFTIGLM